jgi:hypothetical protein
MKCCAFAVALFILLPLLLVYATPVYNPTYDLNGDGKIDGRDITILARDFGAFTTPMPAPPSFINCWPASQYWMSGGTDPNPLYAGADNFYPSFIPGAPSTWPSQTYSVLLAHTNDWIVYDILTTYGTLSAINITLRNLLNPPTGLPPGYPPGTPISIYVFTGSGTPVQWHYGDIATNPSFTWYVNYTFTNTGWLPIYSSNPHVTPSGSEFYIGVHLDNGTNYRPTYPYDRNVEIGWIYLTIT